MERTCPNCHTVNANAAGRVDDACPSCGAIYAKAEVLASQRQRLRDFRERRAAPRADTKGTGSTITMLAWSVAALGCIAAMIQFFLTMGNAASAPQQAAGMAIALAYAVIPYCLARALSSLSGNGG